MHIIREFLFMVLCSNICSLLKHKKLSVVNSFIRGVFWEDQIGNNFSNFCFKILKLDQIRSKLLNLVQKFQNLTNFENIGI